MKAAARSLPFGQGIEESQRKWTAPKEGPPDTDFWETQGKSQSVPSHTVVISPATGHSVSLAPVLNMNRQLKVPRHMRKTSYLKEWSPKQKLQRNRQYRGQKKISKWILLSQRDQKDYCKLRTGYLRNKKISKMLLEINNLVEMKKINRGAGR